MKKLIVLILFISTSAICQKKINQIKGEVSYLDTPLVNAEVKTNSNGESVKSDANGKYIINAAPGQTLSYSYPGMRTMEIIVEDVTRILNIELATAFNQLDEVVVTKTVRKTQKQLSEEYYLNKNLINTAFGIIDQEAVSYRMKIINGKDLPLGGIDFLSAIQGKFPGLRIERMASSPLEPVVYLRGAAGVGFGGAIYDVDGMVYTKAPTFLAVEMIERIAIVTGLNATSKYGFQGNGGVIVINTKSASYGKIDSQIPVDLARLRNNIFENDAIGWEASENVPDYLNQLRRSKTFEEAYDVYREQLELYKNAYHFILDAYQYFAEEQQENAFSDSIIDTNLTVLQNNPIALKALAYLYQAEGKLDKANEIYKQIFTLRPNYAQSYMDLANSYRELGEYQKAAAIYARYGYLLDEGFLRAEGDLGVIMDRELNNLIVVEGNELLSKRELKKLILDDEFDGTRLVFEWNDSEAEFELQFVNPEGNYYTSEHSLFEDADRIKDEKISGFTSEEYLIDDSMRGVWQVNATYFGNKSLTPTYLKATIYHNYGSASQRKETKVFKLSLRNINQQLFTVLNLASVVSN